MLIEVIKIFIASPSGLDAERQGAKRIIDETNESHSENWGCHFKLEGWELTLPGFTRAQTLINQDLDKCEYFVGIIWDHWGSKPDEDKGPYTSGFEEEFERARDRHHKGLMHDIFLFFKDVPENQLKDPGDSLRKVLEFKQKCVDEKKLYFKCFGKPAEFERYFRSLVEAIGWREFKRLRADIDMGEPEKSSDVANIAQTHESTGATLIGPTAAEFLKEILERSADWEDTSPFEVARLRLIATSVARHGNDEIWLGNHDANLLFQKRNEFDFSEHEKSALVDIGVAGFDHQNVPLWHWLAAYASSNTFFSRVFMLSMAGDGAERANAIRVLQCAGCHLDVFDSEFTREKIIRKWFEGGRSAEEAKVAASFLKTNGQEKDLDILVKIYNTIGAEHSKAATEAIIFLSHQRSPSEAMDRLIEFDLDQMGAETIDKVFETPEAISTHSLKQCLTLKSDAVRRKAVGILEARRAIDAPLAKKLLTDSNIEIRLAAIEALVRHGQAPADETIRKALVRPSFGGPFSFAGGTSNDETFFQKYQANRLSELSFKELRRRVENCSVLDELVVNALNERYARRNIESLRASLGDAFKVHFDTRLANWIKSYGADSKLVADTKRLENFVRTNLTSSGLDALCRLKDASEITLVREVLDKFETRYSADVLTYLGKFGNWSDVDRILSFMDRAPAVSPHSLLDFSDRRMNIAGALYRVGKSRIVDLLARIQDTETRESLLLQMTQKDIRSLSDEFILGELNNESLSLRRVLALRCAQSMSQARARQLLHKYIDREGQRYYNSIHWLDLGASMPRDLVKNVSTFELAVESKSAY